jgi:hypothetical protein
MYWPSMAIFTPLIPSMFTASTSLQAEVSTLHRFPKGAWIENIAVRANGHLILVRYDQPSIYTLNPLVANQAPNLLFEFGGNSSVACGIAETSPDFFHVLVGTSVKGSLLGLGYDMALWSINFTANPGGDPVIHQAVPKIPGITGLLNGLAPLSSTAVLASDTFGGIIHRIDVKTGVASSAIKEAGIGVNGVRYRTGFLYYTNMLKGSFSKIPIDAVTGYPTGPAITIAQSTSLLGIDDFALGSSNDEAFICNNVQNQLLKVDAARNVEVLAGSFGSATIPAPTSAQFGRTERDKRTLYVVTSGNIVIPFSGGRDPGGAQIIAVRI